MNGSKTILIAFALAVIPFSHGYGSDRQPRELGWMIVNHDAVSMSSMKDMDDLDRLKRRFGGEFLFVRDNDDRYVIRDRALLKRAWEAQRPVGEAGAKVGRAARADAMEALSGWDEDADQARLARKIEKLSRKIDRAEARGESPQEIQREREQLERIRDNGSDDRSVERPRVHEKEHEAQRRDADEGLDRAIKNMKREVRAILGEAKSRHLAQLVE